MSPELIGVFGTGIALAAAFIPFLVSIRREGRDAHAGIASSIEKLGSDLSARMDRMDNRAGEDKRELVSLIQESENRTRQAIVELDTRIQASEGRTREAISALDTRIQESEGRTREAISALDTRIQESEGRTREDIRELRAFVGGDRPGAGAAGASAG